MNISKFKNNADNYSAHKKRAISSTLLVVVILILAIIVAAVVIALSNANVIKQVNNGANGNSNAENNTQDNLGGSHKSGKTALELFDANLGGAVSGYKANKLQIGDFVDYDAGNWGEIVTLSVLNAEGTAKATAGAGYTGSGLPTNFGFGGFVAGASKNNNAVSEDPNSNYIQTIDNKSVTGWRVFDVDETTGVITLISAGCPEDYFHYSTTNGGYISEYILTGAASKKSYADTYNSNNSTNYKPRDWSSDYAKGKGATYNVTEIATGAKILTGSDLVDWYTKYMNKGKYYLEGSQNPNSIFQNGSSTDGLEVLNGTQYSNLINNHSYVWLASAYTAESLRNVYPSDGFGRGKSGAFGVRPLIYLASNILLENGGTKEIKDAYAENNSYTYNVWNIVGKQ